MKPIQNQSGQALTEMVLLLALTIFISMLVTRFLQQSGFAQNLIGKPWATLSGMIECGTWAGCKPNAGMSKHPNSKTRILSYQPDESIE